MTDALLWKLKLAGYAAIAILALGIYYKIIVVPKNEITRLEEKLVKKSNETSTVVSYINASDANRTQEEINNVKIRNGSTIIRDSGVLVF